MFKFGKFDIKGKVVLAPMAGYTFNSYRDFMNKFGTCLCYTEMVSTSGLIYDNDLTKEYITFPKSNIPTGVQLFGSEPDDFIKAIKICEEHNPNIDFYDVNMACPVNKVTKTGAGSSLLKDPLRCGDIIRAMKSVTDKPVSAKIRLGWSDSSINFLEVINELEKAGVDLIAIHARTKADLYMGSPKYHLLDNLKDKMNVPLVVSGNIFAPEDAIKALQITKADAVMVARGGVGNPLLILNINHALNDEPLEETNYEKQKQYCLELAKLVVEDKGERIGIRIFRSMGPRFFNGFPNSKKLKNMIASSIETYQDLIDIFNEYEREEIKNDF